MNPPKSQLRLKAIQADTILDFVETTFFWDCSFHTNGFVATNKGQVMIPIVSINSSYLGL